MSPILGPSTLDSPLVTYVTRTFWVGMSAYLRHIKRSIPEHPFSLTTTKLTQNPLYGMRRASGSHSISKDFVTLDQNGRVLSRGLTAS